MYAFLSRLCGDYSALPKRHDKQSSKSSDEISDEKTQMVCGLLWVESIWSVAWPEVRVLVINITNLKIIYSQFKSMLTV